MIRESKKWLLFGVALVLLSPVLSAAQHANDRDRDHRRGCDPHERCQQVAEGGSAASYLLAVGATCLGAMFVRSRFGKPHVS
jgi:hypothetical protein